MSSSSSSVRIKPVVIIGAPRSGTNMLRDALSRLPGVTTWPCDELPLLWRYRNSDREDDALPRSAATEPVRRTVRREFVKQSRRGRAPVVVEKTCANSLRVPFVHEILPEAGFVFIVRDGRDAVSSAMRRWHAPADPRYLLRKARFAPPTELVRRAYRGAWTRVPSRPHPEVRAWWGPIPPGAAELDPSSDLMGAAAAQWIACTIAAQEALDERRTGTNVVDVRYEDFVGQPAQGLEAVVQRLGLEATPSSVERAVSAVHSDRVGAWRDEPLDPERLESLLTPTLERLGYES